MTRDVLLEDAQRMEDVCCALVNRQDIGFDACLDELEELNGKN